MYAIRDRTQDRTAAFAAGSSHRVFGSIPNVADIVGDQLTGVSSASEYRRQLLQGCRHVEVSSLRSDPGDRIVTFFARSTDRLLGLDSHLNYAAEECTCRHSR